jgi:hypothetical protein
MHQLGIILSNYQVTSFWLAAKTEQGDKKFYNCEITLTCDNMQSLPIGELLTLNVDSNKITGNVLH